MELSELTAYAGEKYQMQEQHKWTDFPGFSVLCHPKTGKWVALLMRQWDTDTGTEIQRCDLKCGSSLLRLQKPYLTPPLRMHGSRWIGVCFDERTEPQVVFQLLDQAVASENPQGFTLVLDPPRRSAGTAGYQETALPFSDSIGRPGREQLPAKLHEMRRFYEYGRESEAARARAFYRQAVFMEDYEDDCPWKEGGFVHYFPTYQDLTTRQLRGYFTWRTRLRRGEYQPIAASAAYIYLYELLNGVGAPSPEGCLQKMKEFEHGYLDSGIGDARMHANLRRWMLEYAVLQDLPQAAARQAADPAMIARDTAIAVLQSPEARTDEEVFSALCHFGGKRTENSPVLVDDRERGMRLFSEAWRAASSYSLGGKDLITLCFGEKQTRRWYPLSNVVYYERSRPEKRDYALDDSRSYHCRHGIWSVEAYEKLSYDKGRLQSFLHETDARLRRYLKTGRYLRENLSDEWAAPFVEAAIASDRKAVLEAARPRITIDLSGLEQIRRDAADTRDSLLTEEELEEAAEAAAPAAENEKSDIPLDRLQLQILRILLEGGDAMKIIRENHQMASVVADAINEAFFDEIGDTVLLCEGDALALVEDYIEDVENFLGGTGDG